ncbi:MAG: DUF305 domain-containing protein [Candidatus Paceibacterota bacterium]
MEKNQKVVFLITGLVVGIFVGHFIGGGDFKSNSKMHQMPDGTMMHNDHKSGASNMDEMMHSMTASLEGKMGAEFDREFLEQMIIHHEGAVEMARMVLVQSKEAKLINLAQDIIDAQTSEIKMMQNWLNDGFVVTPSTPTQPTPTTPSNPPISPVACTMEAMMCPDGVTYVGRQGPNCEFAKCPGI